VIQPKYTLHHVTSSSFRLISVRFAHAKAANSALFVSGSRAVKVISVVVPEVDVRERREALEASMKARGMSEASDVLNHLSKSFDYLDFIREEEARLAAEVEPKVQALRDATDREESDEVTTPLAEKVKTLKSEARRWKESRWAMEDDVVFQALDLPNELSDAASKGQMETVIRSHLMPKTLKLDHVTLGQKAGELHFPSACGGQPVLTGRLALMERRLQGYVRHSLSTRPQYWPLAGPDLYRSVVLEGCGCDFENQCDSFALKETVEFAARGTGQAMHLTGSASIAPFVSFFSKHILHNAEVLPQTYFHVGKEYRPVKESTSLFNTQQSTCARIFDLSVFESDKKRFKDLLKDVEELYEKLDVHFRILAIPAPALHASESHRISVQMMTSSGDYVEVGHLSCFGHYASRRMMLKAEERRQLTNFRVISGCIMDVTKVLACLIEHAQGDDGTYDFSPMKSI